MKFSSGDIEKIAHLARIALTDEEKTRFGAELSAIIGYIEKLNEIDTGGVEAMTGGTRLESVTRPDVPASELCLDDPETLIAAAPASHSGWIEVKAVFDE